MRNNQVNLGIAHCLVFSNLAFDCLQSEISKL